jgi:predicted transcriptional regulator
MGKLMLWLSTADIDHRTVVLDIWANPKSTILDLIKQVGVSQSTVNFYVDRLSADWAVR